MIVQLSPLPIATNVKSTSEQNEESDGDGIPLYVCILEKKRKETFHGIVVVTRTHHIRVNHALIYVCMCERDRVPFPPDMKKEKKTM